MTMWINNLEDFSGRVLEGFFRRQFRSCLQPVEIARELVKAMIRHKRVSVTNVYVPNVYLVRLHPDDWQEIAPIEQVFTAELADYLAHQAADRELTMIRCPQVSIEVDEEMPQGTLRIIPQYQGQPTLKETWAPEASDETLVFPAVPEKFEAKQNQGLELFVAEGVDLGNSWPLNLERTVVGRKGSNEVVLSDPKVSRVHAQIEHYQDHFFIVDLGSTNGTWLNDQRVDRSRLRPGDKLKVGETVLEVREHNWH